MCQKKKTWKSETASPVEDAPSKSGRISSIEKVSIFLRNMLENPLTPVAELFLTRIGFQKIFKDAIRFQNGTQTPTAYWRLC